MKKSAFVCIAIFTALILTGCPEPKSDPEPVVYALRDTGPAGGLIFYIDEADEFSWDYLEAAPVSTEWIGEEWGSYDNTIGGTGTAIGDGSTNTTTIVTWLDTNMDDTYGDVTNKTDRAAYLCDALSEVNSGVTYTDWFLPSKDELNKMYVNLHSGIDEYAVIFTPAGGFTDSSYWSSTEDNPWGAWEQGFDDGNQDNNVKTTTLIARAVRVF